MANYIVTGCSGGIGKILCLRLLEMHPDCRVYGLDIAHAHGIVHDRFSFMPLNLADPSAVESFCHQWLEQHRALACLFNVAAMQVCKPLWELSCSEWEATFRVNLTAPWLLTRFLLPALGAASSIVNIASVHATATSANISAYAASKSALIGLTRNMALELAPRGIRVNAVSPGAIDTPMLRDGLGRACGPDDDPDDVWCKFNAKHPMKRVGKPDEIADVCLFLSSDRASYITGANITVDGGVLARLCTE